MSSTAIDPEIAAAFGGTANASPPPDSATYDPEINAAFSSDSSSKSDKPGKRPSVSESALGIGEGLLHATTGGIGALAGGLSYVGRALEGGTNEEGQKERSDIQDLLTYRPRTDEGKKAGHDIDTLGSYLGEKEGTALGDKTLEVTGSPALATAANVAANIPQFLVGEGLGRGFKGKAPVPDVSRAKPPTYQSPEPANLQPLPAPVASAVETAKAAGEDPATVTRHLQAASLPVPMQLTEGMATQNHALLADEFNRRNTPEGAPIANLMNLHNTQLVQNLNAIRDKAAPDAALRSTDEHAQTLISAYEADKEAASANISAKYKALTDANGGDFPVDGQKAVSNIDAALKQKLKTGHLSSGLASALNEFRDGERPMNFEDFETLRTDAATDMRAGGNQAAAAGVVRQELEKLPLTGDAAKLKPVADEARAAARAQFEKEAADPAYKAVVDGKAATNTFFNKHVLNAPRENVQTMVDNIGANPDVQQALAGGTTNFLKQRAGIVGESNGNFGQSGYNRALESVRPKLDLLADKPTTEHLNTLGDVARYTQAQPRGKAFNNSGTEVVRQGEVRSAIGGMAASAAEHGVNIAAKGLPLGTIARTVYGARAAAKAAAAEQASRQAATARALAPGAGIAGNVSYAELLRHMQSAAGSSAPKTP